MTTAAWPKTLEIPSGARRQWRALREALAVSEPPCAADPELWHSRRPDEIAAACDACHHCPALRACGAYATAAHEQLGVSAGHDRTPPRATAHARHLNPERKGTQ